MRKNKCIDHREKHCKLDFESQVEVNAKLQNLVALFCEYTPCGTSVRALT